EEPFWRRLEARCRQLSLPGRLAERCRGTLPLALAALHGGFALHRAGLGEVASVKQHAAHLTAAAVGPEVMREALADPLSKARKRARPLCASTAEGLSSEPARAGEAVAQLLDRAVSYLMLIQLSPPAHGDQDAVERRTLSVKL